VLNVPLNPDHQSITTENCEGAVEKMSLCMTVESLQWWCRRDVGQ